MNSILAIWTFAALILNQRVSSVPSGSAKDVVGSEQSGSELDLSITREPVDGECLNKNKIAAASTLEKGQSGNSNVPGDHSSICTGIEWNSTYKTNLLGYMTDSPSTTFWMGNFQPLIGLKCSSNTERFLCSLALPICTDRTQSAGSSKKAYIIPPCKELCEQVQYGCEHNMNAYGFQWPYPCDLFPSNKTAKSMCVPPSAVEHTRPQEFDHHHDPKTGKEDSIIDSNSGGRMAVDSFTCPDKLKTKRGLGYTFLGAEDCSAPCKEVLFSSKDYDVARYWIGCWSFICFLSSLFTFATYLVDRRRFKYPERPIMFMAFCYVFISFTFFIGFFGQKSISCSADHLAKSPTITSSASNSDSSVEIVSQGIKSNVFCALSFFVLYYCLMASSIWWVMLTFTWLLAAGLKWSHEAIERKAFVFHAIAWLVPFFLTALVPFFNGIEGDDISGTCFTGMLNPDFTLYFVLTPLVISLLIGCTFLVFGFFSLCRVRHFIKKNGDRTDKLEKLMIRIGVFSLFYMAPAIILISCFCYEFRFRRSWQEHWWHSHCTSYQNVGSYHQCMFTQSSQNSLPASDYMSGSNTGVENSTANFYVFLLRYFVTLAVGVTSSFWLWSKKTFDSWRNVLCMNSVSTAGSNNPLFAANAQQTIAMTKKLTAVNNANGVNTGQGHGTNGVTSIVAGNNHASGVPRKTQLNNVPGAAFV